MRAVARLGGLFAGYLFVRLLERLVEAASGEVCAQDMAAYRSSLPVPA